MRGRPNSNAWQVPVRVVRECVLVKSVPCTWMPQNLLCDTDGMLATCHNLQIEAFESQRNRFRESEKKNVCRSHCGPRPELIDSVQFSSKNACSYSKGYGSALHENALNGTRASRVCFFVPLRC